MKGNYGKSKMPNQGKGGGGRRRGATNTGASTGLRKEDSQRADVLKKPSSKNPYPHGLA